MNSAANKTAILAAAGYVPSKLSTVEQRQLRARQERRAARSAHNSKAVRS